MARARARVALLAAPRLADLFTVLCIHDTAPARSHGTPMVTAAGSTAIAPTVTGIASRRAIRPVGSYWRTTQPTRVSGRRRDPMRTSSGTKATGRVAPGAGTT